MIPTFKQSSLIMIGLLSAVQAFVIAPSQTVNRIEYETRLAVQAATETESVIGSETTETVTAKSANPMFEYLKFDGNPKFDVLAKTKEYTDIFTRGEKPDESLYADDYVLRGPVIGPIVRKDLALSQNGLGLNAAYPNVEISSFGHTIDPENPYRCFFFQRWRAKHEADLDAYGDIYPASGKVAEMPVSTFSIVWNPEGKIIYEQVGAVVDRLEGNTAGKAAVFGLLHFAGLKIPASPGDKTFSFIQRLGHVLGGRGRSWSRKVDIPSWWVSPSRGADATEQW
jgi:hypothetical protein